MSFHRHSKASNIFNEIGFFFTFPAFNKKKCLKCSCRSTNRNFSNFCTGALGAGLESDNNFAICHARIVSFFCRFVILNLYNFVDCVFCLCFFDGVMFFYGAI